MATTVGELGLGAQALRVEGVLPAELEGVFLQCGPHPAGDRPTVLAGIRLGGGRAEWYRGQGAQPGQPVPDLGGGAVVARPVREPSAPRWHTVATYPGLNYAEHLVMAADGSIMRAEPFPLDGAPLISAVAITDRFVIVLDLPVTYRRAAAMIGTGIPYAWQPNRPARIGLLPLRGKGATPRWFAIDPCYVFDIVNAYDNGDRVVLDAVRNVSAFDPGQEPQDAYVCRWELDLSAGSARARRLTDAIEHSAVDERVSAQRHRFLFSTTGDAVVRHDLATWRTEERALGLRTSQPVFVPRGGSEGEGWLLVLVEDVVHRCGALLVLDAMDLAGSPRAVVQVPVALPSARRATWLSDTPQSTM